MAEQLQVTQYRPSTVSPPGETLLELLEERGISQTEFAQRTGRPRKTINEIIHGKTAITAETALQFELVLGVPASFWTVRESRYRESLARQEEAKRLQSMVEWAREFPYAEMARKGWVPKTRKGPDKVHSLLEFFGVASADQWNMIYQKLAVSFRKSDSFRGNTYALAAWLRRGSQIAERRPCGQYDEDAFRACLHFARQLTRVPPEEFQPKLEKICAEAGVAVVFVPQISGCHAHGATRWIAPDRAIMQLSIRYKTEDQLWFSFFHEAAHILFHRKKDIFLETNGDEHSKEEEEANRFAANFLIDVSAMEELRSMPVYSRAAVSRFAEQEEVSPGIVVGRLQYEGLLPHSHLNDLKLKLEWG